MTNKNFEVLKSPAGCQCPQTLPLVLEKQFAWKEVGNRKNSTMEAFELKLSKHT